MEAPPVLDSDVLIDHLRDAGPGRELVEALTRTTGYLVTSVSAFELAAGREYEHEPGPADRLLAMPLLTLTREAAIRAGTLLRDLRSRGMGIDVRDAMQAGICLDVGASLVTRNARHFERVPGLRVVDPGRWPD